MHRILLLGLALATIGCSSNTAPSVNPTTTVSVADLGSAGGTFQTTRSADVGVERLPVSPERAWPILTKTYADLGLTAAADPTSRAVGINNQRVRRVGGKPMTEFVDCIGPYGNAAASSDVYLSLRTQLVSAQGGGTEARTQLHAQARSTSSGSPVQCSSKGTLELLIATMLREQTAAP